MGKIIKNLEASLYQQLRNLAQDKGEEVEAVLYRYVIERFLYRLSVSSYKDKFFLKGAILFTLWDEDPHRPTRDVDFLGEVAHQIKPLEKIVKEISSISCKEDGLRFETQSIKGEAIREGQSYGGIRLKQFVKLGRARVTLKIDIGFGDVITPKAQKKEFPSLLGMQKPTLNTYPIYTVIAEKLEAMVYLDIDNSRMKDFYDLWFLIRKFDINLTQLGKAIKNTFTRRGTDLPKEMPVAFTEAFALNADKDIQWKAFLRKNGLEGNGLELSTVTTALGEFFWPILNQIGG
tara:strand:- start:4748 stop:5617 length:870 start_codon:yes stop_codon:yes gene_type:complete